MVVTTAITAGSFWFTRDSLLVGVTVLKKIAAGASSIYWLAFFVAKTVQDLGESVANKGGCIGGGQT